MAATTADERVRAPTGSDRSLSFTVEMDPSTDETYVSLQPALDLYPRSRFPS